MATKIKYSLEEIDEIIDQLSDDEVAKLENTITNRKRSKNNNLNRQSYVINALAILRQKLQEELGPNFISLNLFGSYARDEANKDSDVDVLILVRVKNFDVDQLIHKYISEICIDYDIFISAMIRTQEHLNDPTFSTFPVYMNIEKEKILI